MCVALPKVAKASTDIIGNVTEKQATIAILAVITVLALAPLDNTCMLVVAILIASHHPR
jgi:hypothetical protein